MDVLSTAIRSSLIFLAIIIAARFMGKRQFSQLTFFDYLTATSVGAIGGTLSINNSINMINGLTGIIVWSLLAIGLSFIELQSRPARKLLDGRPVVVIENGKILENNMAQLRYNLDDLLMQLRIKNIFDLSEVEFALVETNGELSVLKKSQLTPLTPKDLSIQTEYKGLATELTVEGRIQYANLAKNKLSTSWLLEQLHTKGIDRISDIVLASLSTQGELYIDKRENR